MSDHEQPAQNDPSEFMAEAPHGAVIYAFSAEPDLLMEVLVREDSFVIEDLKAQPPAEVQIRAALLIQDEVMVVVLMFSLHPAVEEMVYPSFWNFHDPANQDSNGNIFHHLAEQDTEMALKLFGDTGRVEHLTVLKPPLRSFFRQALTRVESMNPWSMEQFLDALSTIRKKHPTPRDLWNALA